MNPEQVDLVTDPPNADRLGELRRLCPEAFADGHLSPSALADALGYVAYDDDDERYRLNWAGRIEAQRAVQRQSIATLSPDHERSVNYEASEHVMIEGDNLEILRLLQRAYNDRVRLIYIDPPYNTGSDFIYPDNFQHRDIRPIPLVVAVDDVPAPRPGKESSNSGRIYLRVD
jgi:adenine-specific DNA-methyltransferase